MQDTKLFETILGITTPWHVARLELKTDDKRVDVWLEYEATRWPCPECDDILPGFDHADERTWRHLDTCQFQTHLHAEIPRVQCPTHGVKPVRVPWAEPRSRFTVLMERLIIDHTIVCDLGRSTVEFVTEERKTESLAAYYRQLTDAQRAALQAVAMDMWEPVGAVHRRDPRGSARRCPTATARSCSTTFTSCGR